MNFWEIASIAFAGWSALTMVTAGVRGLRKSEIDLWTQFRNLLVSIAVLVAYLLVMDLGLTTKAAVAGGVGGIALGLVVARLAGNEDDYGVIVARGSGLALLPTAAASCAAIWGGIEGRDGVLAAGMLGLMASAGMAFGQTAYWAMAQAGTRRGAVAGAPVSVEALSRVEFPESVYVCTNGHPVEDPSYEFCLACGAPKLSVAPRTASGPVVAGPAAAAGSQPVDTCSCGARLEPGLRFCTSCGRAVSLAPAGPTAERRCPGCGAPLATSDRFCALCGARAA